MVLDVVGVVAGTETAAVVVVCIAADEFAVIAETHSGRDTSWGYTPAECSVVGSMETWPTAVAAGACDSGQDDSDTHCVSQEPGLLAGGL